MAKIKTGVMILTILVVLAFLFASPGESDMTHYLSSPGIYHPFGFDSFGRNLFPRSLYASILSLLISGVSTILSSLAALLFLFLSLKKNIFRTIIYSLLKAVRSVPTIILALFVLSVSGGGIFAMIFTFVLSGSAGLYIILLPLLGRMESEEYIVAERSLGIREGRIYTRHIIPELLPIVRENGAGMMMTTILSESSLSFLGLSGDISLPTLGRLLSDGRPFILTHPHVLIGPGIILFLISLSFLLISEGLSDLDSSAH